MNMKLRELSFLRSNLKIPYGHRRVNVHRGSIERLELPRPGFDECARPESLKYYE